METSGQCDVKGKSYLTTKAAAATLQDQRKHGCSFIEHRGQLEHKAILPLIVTVLPTISFFLFLFCLLKNSLSNSHHDKSEVSSSLSCNKEIIVKMNEDIERQQSKQVLALHIYDPGSIPSSSYGPQNSFRNDTYHKSDKK